MKKYDIKTADITAPNSIEGIKFRIQDLTYIQDGVLENDIAFAESIIQGNIPSSIPVIVNGCKITKTGNTYDVEAGTIYYEKMFYTVLAGTLTTPNVPRWAIDTSPSGAYDRRFVTSQNNNQTIEVNKDYQMELVATGGIRDYNKLYTFKQLMVYNSYTFEDLRIVHNFTGTDFETSRMGKPYGRYAGFAIADSANVSPIGNPSFAGKFLAGVNGLNPDYAGAGVAGGQDRVTLTKEQCAMQDHVHNVSATQAPHNHGGNTGNGGGHKHTGSTSTNGAHTHNVGVIGATNAEFGSGRTELGGGNRTTSSNGDHSHTLNIDNAPAHVHTISDATPAITVTETTIGRDATQAFDNRPSYITVGYLVKVELPM